MARKKRSSKKRHHRRRGGRRMSGVHPVVMQGLELLGGAALGATAGVFANQAIKTSVTSIPPVAIGLGIAAAGAAIPLFLKPNPFVMGLAAGMAGTGSVFAINEAGLSLPGISGTPFGVPNARPTTGFLNRTVGYVNAGKYPPGRIGGRGNLSGNTASVVGRILNN